MPTVLGSLRRLLLTPSLAEVSFGRRGFGIEPSAVTRHLEAVPQSVVCGFEWGIDARDMWELERRLEIVEPQLRGYAYEGAAMAYTILDVMRPGKPVHASALIGGPGLPHLFLCYIGIGFAMARLPRPAWKNVIPDLPGVPYHPTMSWLAVDGYGFDRAYFDTHKWVDGQRVADPYPWEGHPDYFTRAFDQGIGRALWFIHAANTVDVAAAVSKFASHRQADLWGGVGIAAAFAGGSDRHALIGLRAASGPHHPDLALGTVFAAKARDYAGFVPRHTEIAVSTLADMTVAAAAALADDTAVTPTPDPRVPAYEQWRQRIREQF